MRVLFGVAVALFAVSISQAAQLRSDTAEATAGNFRLSWETPVPVRLVESRDREFSVRETVYSGADTARVVSGKPDGDWHYRLENVATGEIVAGPITVAVRHHSLPKAWAFFAVGAVVFLATVGLVYQGSRAVRD